MAKHVTINLRSKIVFLGTLQTIKGKTKIKVEQNEGGYSLI